MPIQKTALTATADVSRIVQGEELTITVEIADKFTGQVLDLEGATVATATFRATDVETPVEKTLAAGVTLSEQPGRLEVTLDEDDTAALLVGEAQSWQVEVTVAGETRIVILEEALDVVAALF